MAQAFVTSHPGRAVGAAKVCRHRMKRLIFTGDYPNLAHFASTPATTACKILRFDRSGVFGLARHDAAIGSAESE
jgi:hypothetical protein